MNNNDPASRLAAHNALYSSKEANRAAVTGQELDRLLTEAATLSLGGLVNSTLDLIATIRFHPSASYVGALALLDEALQKRLGGATAEEVAYQGCDDPDDWAGYAQERRQDFAEAIDLCAAAVGTSTS
jgi:hypothetical protein